MLCANKHPSKTHEVSAVPAKMRSIIVMLGLMLALATGANIPDAGTEVDCSVYTLPMCTREHNPVCGTNGVDYANECMLCLHNFETKQNIFEMHKGMC